MQGKQTRLLSLCAQEEFTHQIINTFDGLDYAIRTETNVTEGLIACRELKPDVVLFCISPEEENSIELLKLLLDESPYVPCIVLSHCTDPEFIIKLLKAGAVELLSLNNFEQEELLLAVKRQTKRYQLIMQHAAENAEEHPKHEVLRSALAENSQSEETANAMKDLFLANVSHELRTPLHGILGLSDLIITGISPDSTIEYCLTIRHSALELLGSVNKLIDMANLESNRLLLRTESFSLRDNLRDCLIVYLDQAQWKGLSLNYRVASKTPDRLVGDIGRLKQILEHLLSNAIKFTAEGRVELEIDIAPEKTIKPDDEQLHNTPEYLSKQADHNLDGRVSLIFRVKDTGAGISDEQKQDIFNPFSMGENFLIKRYRGLGLGLSIAQSLTKLMGGKLSVESNINNGSIFTLELDFWESGSAGATNTMMAANTLAAANPNSAPNSFHQIQNNNNYKKNESAPLNLESLDSGYGAQLSNHSPFARMKSNVQDKQKNSFSSQMPISFIPFKSLGADKTKSAQEEALKGLPKKTVLLVEDDPVNRILAMGFLEAKGYNLLSASNGQEALDIIDKEYVDLILMDIQMPVMDGVTATKKIREKGGRFARLPIIAITAHALDGDREHFLNSGFSSYVSKPVNFPKLLEDLKRMFD